MLLPKFEVLFSCKLPNNNAPCDDTYMPEFFTFCHHPFRFLLKDVLTYGQEEIRIKFPTLQFVDLLHHLTYNSCAAQVSFLPPPSHLAPSFVLPFLQPFNIIYLVHLDLKGFCCCGHCPEV